MTAAAQTALSPVQQPDLSRRDELITEHLHLVTAIAAHVGNSLPVHVELDDLVHAGTMGLIDAATKYRDDKDVVFPTYAKHRIRGAILDSLRQGDWASRDLRRRYKQMERVKEDLTAKLGRTPVDAEVAGEMGLDSRRWQALMVDFRSLHAASTQHHVYEGEEQLAPEIPACAEDGPDQIFARTQLREKLSAAAKSLPVRYQQVVKMYYEGDLTMKEIGARLGVNESRVSQIHKGALERMQVALGSFGVSSALAF